MTDDQDTRRPRGVERITSGPLFRVLRPVLGPTAVAVTVQAVGSLCSVIPFCALLELADRLTQHQDVGGALIWFVAGLGIQSACGFLALLITHFADVGLQATLRRTLSTKLGRLPLGWFGEHSSGRVRQIVQNDVDSLHQLVAHTLVESVAGVLTPAVGLVFCFAVDWRLGLAVTAPMVLYFTVFSALSRTGNRDIMARVSDELGAVSAAITDYFRGVVVLKVFGRAGEKYGRFTAVSERFRAEFTGLVRPAMRAQAVASVFLTASVMACSVFAVGVWSVQQHWTRAASVLVVSTVAMMLPAAILTIATSAQARAEAVEAAGRIVRLLDEPELPVTDREAELDGAAVEVRDVSFGYRQDRPVLRDITLTFPARTTTALVGPSGAGKSTLTALLARFHDVDRGEIRLGGVDVRDIPPGQLYRTVGVLLQEPQLPAVSVAENIALGRPDATRAEIERAAREALIHDRIAALPKGYDAVVGTDARLSGGEAQRIAIARLLLADAPVLVLDEAMSAIDPDAAALLHAALRRLAEGRTVIMIAHRLGSTTGADNTVVLEDGRVVEQGTHAQLLEHKGVYARMWNDWNDRNDWNDDVCGVAR
ncbi:ABC transporter ATP-binding protein [Streptomyces sp. CT34]|uniref:ABC transporter ATP-binding protein n=1 Tax=Streptomyces sp. CT34 TaxID=1553907 RepID=UPI00068FA90F|nr:ABC transporter ATP-binding protein [Streptomyces sp. CT34]